MMKEIARFDCTGASIDMDGSEAGEWVRYFDHLVAIDSLRIEFRMTRLQLVQDHSDMRDRAEQAEARSVALVETVDAAQDVEPWGYLHTLPDGRWKVTKGSEHGGGFNTWAAVATPLYTKPQSAKDAAALANARGAK